MAKKRKKTSTKKTNTSRKGRTSKGRRTKYYRGYTPYKKRKKRIGKAKVNPWIQFNKKVTSFFKIQEDKYNLGYADFGMDISSSKFRQELYKTFKEKGRTKIVDFNEWVLSEIKKSGTSIRQRRRNILTSRFAEFSWYNFEMMMYDLFKEKYFINGTDIVTLSSKTIGWDDVEIKTNADVTPLFSETKRYISSIRHIIDARKIYPQFDIEDVLIEKDEKTGKEYLNVKMVFKDIDEAKPYLPSGEPLRETQEKFRNLKPIDEKEEDDTKKEEPEKISEKESKELEIKKIEAETKLKEAEAKRLEKETELQREKNISKLLEQGVPFDQIMKLYGNK